MDGGAFIAAPTSQTASFMMPAVPVTVRAEFKRIPADSSTSSGSNSGGGTSKTLGYIGVIGVPDGPVPTTNSIMLTTIPVDTQVKSDENHLSMRENADGSRTFTALKAGKVVITFSKRGYHDRDVEIEIVNRPATLRLRIIPTIISAQARQPIL